MKTLTTLLALSTLAIAIPLGTADHCTTWSTSEPEAEAAPYYFDVDFPADGVWIYEETNGIPGLQRGDSIVDDTCHGQIESDTIIL